MAKRQQNENQPDEIPRRHSDVLLLWAPAFTLAVYIDAVCKSLLPYSCISMQCVKYINTIAALLSNNTFTRRVT